jgi:hypothetical protein
LQIPGPVAAVGRSQIGRDEGFDRLADQLSAVTAERVLYPPADRRQSAILAGQRQPVGQGVDHRPQQLRGDGCRARVVFVRQRLPASAVPVRFGGGRLVIGLRRRRPVN